MLHLLIETGLTVSGGFAAFQIFATINHAMPEIASALAGRGIDRTELPVAAMRHRAARRETRIRWSGNSAVSSATARRVKR